MDAGSAVMIFMMCSQGSGDCMEIRSERTYETAAICRDALPATIGRLSHHGRTVRGHCETAAATFSAPPRPEIDPMITCSTGSADMLTVHVTRPVGDRFVTSELIVPRQRRGCG